MIIKTVKPYNYDELSESAKERAREWYANFIGGSFESECTLSELSQTGEILGIRFDEKNVSFNADPWGRGTYFVFKGTYEYKKGWQKLLRAEYGGDMLKELLKIGKRLENAQKRAFYAITGCLYVSNFRGRCQAVELDDTTEEIRKEIEAGINDFCYFCESQMITLFEYIYSDGYIEDQIRINEYTFNENGERED